MSRFLRFLPPALLLAASALAEDTVAPAPAPGTAAVLPAETALSAEQVLSDLGRDLHDRFNLSGELQVDFCNPWAPPVRLAKAWRVAVVDFPPGAGASMIVRYRILADGAVVEDSTVVLRAALWRDAWIAREPLVSGESLDPTRFELRRIDSFRVREAVPAGTPTADLILVRSVQAGNMLNWADLGHRPLVRKGDVIDVMATLGLLHVSMKAIALQNGGLGDVVTVRNPESLKTVPALVVGESRVEVRL
jgi:flagella basal body P-ring formation protein FlgA